MEKLQIDIQQKYLDNVRNLIIDKIKECEENFSKQEHFIIGFKEGLRGTQFTRQSLMSFYATEINNLKAVLAAPYFASMDIVDEDGKEKTIYIGKKNIVDKNNNILVYDWRSPMGAVYYDFVIGDFEYTQNEETVKGKILNKKQIIIHNGIVQDIVLHDNVSDDKILLKYLEEDDNRLKSIVATIQKEQNRIIRNDISNSYIVNGVAGSGKTTVALHRIAYLLYNYNKKLSRDDFLIIGPNDYFLDYISNVLPELDIENVNQSTFIELATSILKKKFKVQSQNMMLENIINKKISSEVIRYKTSLEFMDALEDYVIKYLQDNLDKDITYQDIVLCEGHKIKEFVFKSNNSDFYNKMLSYSKMIKKKIIDNKDEYSSTIWSKYRNEFLKLPKDNPRRKEILDITNKCNEVINNGCSSVLKDYFKFANINILDLYIKFIQKYDFKIKEMNDSKEEIISRLKKKIISYEDLAPLLLINYLLYGNNTTKKYNHLVIDECQDITINEYYMLMKYFPNAKIDMYGDMNQAIYGFNRDVSLDTINRDIFDNSLVSCYLNKSYRNTKQISNVGCNILEYINANVPEFVAREGKDVSIIDKTSDKKNIILLDTIKEFLDKEYKSIAIICKDMDECIKLKKSLFKDIDVNIIDDNSNKYINGICIIPVYLAKGLEFDGVIINDASSEKYNSDLDYKLLYVAITRAMYELRILYNNELTLPLSKKEKEYTRKRTI